MIRWSHTTVGGDFGFAQKIGTKSFGLQKVKSKCDRFFTEAQQSQSIYQLPKAVSSHNKRGEGKAEFVSETWGFRFLSFCAETMMPSLLCKIRLFRIFLACISRTYKPLLQQKNRPVKLGRLIDLSKCMGTAMSAIMEPFTNRSFIFQLNIHLCFKFRTSHICHHSKRSRQFNSFLCALLVCLSVTKWLFTTDSHCLLSSFMCK